MIFSYEILSFELEWLVLSHAATITYTEQSIGGSVRKRIVEREKEEERRGRPTRQAQEMDG